MPLQLCVSNKPDKKFFFRLHYIYLIYLNHRFICSTYFHIETCQSIVFISIAKFEFVNPTFNRWFDNKQQYFKYNLTHFNNLSFNKAAEYILNRFVCIF